MLTIACIIENNIIEVDTFANKVAIMLGSYCVKITDGLVETSVFQDV